MSCKATELSAQDLGGVGVIMNLLEPELDLVRSAARVRIKTRDWCADRENDKYPSYCAQIVTLALHMHDENDCFTGFNHFFLRGQMTHVIQNFPKLLLPGIVCPNANASRFKQPFFENISLKA